MTESNRITPDIRAKFDAACKNALSNRRTLAFLLKECACEFQDIPVDTIENECIEGTPEVAAVPVHRNIRGAATEDPTSDEGVVTYDIRFYAVVPGGKESIRLIVNVEPQNVFNPGYPLLKRALYYCSRMISSQYGTEFEQSHYEAIQKVYSIWICLNPPKDRRNTITIYEIREKNLVGSVHEPRENYDLQQVVMVCLGAYEGVKDREGVLPLMDAMFMSGMQREKRRQVITEQYGIPASDGQEGDEKMMFSFSDVFYEQGREEGMEKGMEQGMEKGMEKGIFSILFQLVNDKVISETEGACRAKLSLSEFRAKLKSYNESENAQEKQLQPA